MINAEVENVIEFLRKLVPDSRRLRTAAEVVAESIRVAHREAPSSWEVSLRPKGDRVIRLNVGQILVIHWDEVRMALYTLSGPPPSEGWCEPLSHESYDAVPESTQCWNMPLEHLESISPDLRQRHHDLILAAIRAKRRTSFARHHSPATVYALARLTKRSLPQPEYVSGSEPTDIAPAEEAPQSAAWYGSAENNREVEQAAISFVTRYYEKEGWLVRSREQEGCGFDLECRKGTEELHIEVKGTRGEASGFFMTRNEVRCADSDPHFMLVLVGHALSEKPILEEFRAPDPLRHFKKEPVQYKVWRRAAE